MYKVFTENDTFSDRILILFIHFAFFIKSKKNNTDNKILQKVHDDFFKLLEYDIREVGHGDVTVNKKMKDYLNSFYFIIDKIHYWENLEKTEKDFILKKILNTKKNISKLTDYFEKFNDFTLKNTLNFFTKGVIKLKF